jgi:hypothetical protein
MTLSCEGRNGILQAALGFLERVLNAQKLKALGIDQSEDLEDTEANLRTAAES